VTEKQVINVFKKVSNSGKEIAKTIPFAGTAITAIE
jgi:hypothetical protein